MYVCSTAAHTCSKVKLFAPLSDVSRAAGDGADGD